MNDKSLFFMTLSLICVWVILDNIYGKKYLDIFLSNVFDFYNTSVTTTSKTFNEKGLEDYYNNIDGDPNDELTAEEKRNMDIIKNTPQW